MAIGRRVEWRRVAAASVMLTGVLVIGTQHRAEACSCIIASPEVEFADADVVLAGTALSAEPIGPIGHLIDEPWARDESGMQYVVQVDAVFKGSATERQGVLSGYVCAPGVDVHETRQRYLVYANRQPSGALSVSACSFEVPFDEALVSTLPTARAPNPGVDLVDVPDEPGFRSAYWIGGIWAVLTIVIGTGLVIAVRRRHVSSPWDDD